MYTTTDLSQLRPAEPQIAALGAALVVVGARHELPRRPDQLAPWLPVLGLSRTRLAVVPITAAASEACIAQVGAREPTALHAAAAASAYAHMRANDRRSQTAALSRGFARSRRRQWLGRCRGRLWVPPEPGMKHTVSEMLQLAERMPAQGSNEEKNSKRIRQPSRFAAWSAKKTRGIAQAAAGKFSAASNVSCTVRMSVLIRHRGMPLHPWYGVNHLSLCAPVRQSPWSASWQQDSRNHAVDQLHPWRPLQHSETVRGPALSAKSLGSCRAHGCCAV